ncbi:1-phosphofructokinase family hexose kinase [Gordonia zhaorongruii]|uniref:1-phosphofructokinase family hexose kinase n=1 Tax=Gordonia zhaorongruii TaxID=2597659 RepID=UPI0010440E82|nr:hexose kinase [Gordonia zhaorongruii]
MIVTVTANPSIDRTAEIDGPLRPGGVHRTLRTHDQPGGKGVNVSRVVAAAGLDTLAVIPARAGDPFLAHLDRAGLPHAALDVHGDVRVNLTIADPDGITTKVNAPGATLGEAAAAALTDAVLARAAGADWIALCGSLPPGLPESWYADLVGRLSDAGIAVAVDTSGPPLRWVAGARPGLMKPNAEELAELTGADPAELESAATNGDPSAAAEATADLAATTGGAILTTLGAAGALLADSGGVWFATAPKVRVRSTVGAGDSSLAGYLIAHRRGTDPADRLRSAVAYGSAAAALHGTTPPTPDLLDQAGATVTRLL